MRPIFTIHAGEYIVADHIERKFKGLRVWIPSKDDGQDLLVTDRVNKKAISIQVKFSKDFLLQNAAPFLRENLSGWGWWSIDAAKLAKSEADFWVFAIMDFFSKEANYIVIPPKLLLEKFTAIHGRKKLWQIYIMVTKKGQCFETRGLSQKDQIALINGDLSAPDRDLTQWMNWEPVSRLA